MHTKPLSVVSVLCHARLLVVLWWRWWHTKKLQLEKSISLVNKMSLCLRLELFIIMHKLNKTQIFIVFGAFHFFVSTVCSHACRTCDSPTTMRGFATAASVLAAIAVANASPAVASRERRQREPRYFLVGSANYSPKVMTRFRELCFELHHQ